LFGYVDRHGRACHRKSGIPDVRCFIVSNPGKPEFGCHPRLSGGLGRRGNTRENVLSIDAIMADGMSGHFGPAARDLSDLP
jgi:hypothetical protein